MNFIYDPKPLEKARLERGWTKVKVACKVGVHPVAIARVEAGKNQNPRTILKMCKILGVKVDAVVIENRE